MLEIAKVVMRYVKFLHPEIVKAIVLDNIEKCNVMSDILIDYDIDPNLYLWPNSSTTFPGVRRHQGKFETSFKHKPIKNSNIKNALYIDDNDFPKHIWNFSLFGKRFNKKGINGYELSHLIDHKDYYTRRRNSELKLDSKLHDKAIYGLFSAVSNTVYLPKELSKLTDTHPNIRLLLINKAQLLYGDFCNIVPDEIKIPIIDKDDDWHPSNFEGKDKLVGDIKYIDKFIEFRKKFYDEYLD